MYATQYPGSRSIMYKSDPIILLTFHVSLRKHTWTETNKQTNKQTKHPNQYGYTIRQRTQNNMGRLLYNAPKPVWVQYPNQYGYSTQTSTDSVIYCTHAGLEGKRRGNQYRYTRKGSCRAVHTRSRERLEFTRERGRMNSTCSDRSRVNARGGGGGGGGGLNEVTHRHMLQKTVF